MNYRAPLLLILLILVPLLLLGWLGVRLQQNERQLLGLQLQKLVEQQLETVDGQLQGHFQQLERLLQQQARRLHRLADPDYPADRLRAFLKDSAQVRQLFVLDDRDERLFPPRQQPLSADEQRLVEQLQPLWQSPDLFRPAGADPLALDTSAGGDRDYLASGQLARQAPAELADAFRTESEPAAAPAAEGGPATASGWIAWYANAGLMHIYWWRDPQGRILGFVLNDARLLSDLINRLPDGGEGDSQLGRAEIRLLDSHDETLYGWGAYRGEGPALRSIGLSHPLGSWKLEYHAPELQQVSSGGWLGSLVSLLLLATGLGSLGYLLDREHRRELRLAQQRVNFVNQVSHELKTPLTNVRLYAEMLQERLDDEGTEPTVRRYLGVIAGESQRLSRLIDNVLSFSRLQRQQLRLTPEPGNPDEQVERILQTFAPLLLQRGIDLSFDAGIDRSLRYDPAALEQILNNLLSNCEKYAPDSGLLRIRSWLDGAMLCIEVQDRGPGIDAGERERIFEPFYRSSNRITDGVAGTGIGLGLARDLARAHGGDLSLEPGGSGACFRIRLETTR